MHRPVISKAAAAAASALLLACGGDDDGGLAVNLPRNRLLALARVDSTVPPPPLTSVAVKNNQTRTVAITHTDAGQTLFAELVFPAGSMVQNGTQLVCDTCTVTITVTPTTGVYGFALGPAGLVFRSSSTPIVTISYGMYGDLSVSDSSTLYPNQPAFDQALELWFESSPGLWRRSRNSAHTGPGTVAGAVDRPGAHLLAAPK